MKKIIALALCIMFSFSNTVFAVDGTAITTTNTVIANEPQKFSIAEAISYAKEHNYDIILAKIDEENMKTSKKSAKEAESTAKDSYAENKENDNFSNYKTRNGYNILSVKNQEKLLNLKNTQKVLSLEISVETAYYNLSEKKTTYDIKKRTTDQIANQLNIAENKLKNGSISQLDYKKVELEKGSADVALMSSEADYKKAMFDFNQILGLPIMQQVILTDEIVPFTYVIPTFDEKFEELKATDTTYVQYVLNKDLSESENRLTRAYYGSNSDQYKQLLKTEDQTKINFNRYFETMQYNLIFNIINLNIAARNITLDDQSIQISKLTLDATKHKYLVGLISDMDMITAELNYQNAELKYVQQLHSYKTQVLKFKNNI
ncbi:MAG TPA: hypothetical protein DEP72_05140 [Clostridiales bacterium]|nr:MAG: hypothetical protein A2Y18_02290 [Clostridiales bacterium GWD2_32_19]HCC07526.1 hypothetical protein [Clostridiales bacterium]